MRKDKPNNQERNPFWRFLERTLPGGIVGVLAGAFAAHAWDTFTARVWEQHTLDLAALLVALGIAILVSLFSVELKEHRKQIADDVLEMVEAARIDGQYYYGLNKEQGTSCRDKLALALSSARREVKAILSCQWGEELENKVALLTGIIKAEGNTDSLTVILHEYKGPESNSKPPIQFLQKLATINSECAMTLDDRVGPDFLMIEGTDLFVLISRVNDDGALELEGILHIQEIGFDVKSKKIVGAFSKYFVRLMQLAKPFKQEKREAGTTSSSSTR